MHKNTVLSLAKEVCTFLAGQKQVFSVRRMYTVRAGHLNFVRNPGSAGPLVCFVCLLFTK
jgi:hypothetical protein